MTRAINLLCRLGKHAPVANGRWNAGYCFTTCRRCGRDMVRSVFGEWHVPRDFRVVWGHSHEWAGDPDMVIVDRRDPISVPTPAAAEIPAPEIPTEAIPEMPQVAVPEVAALTDIAATISKPIEPAAIFELATSLESVEEEEQEQTRSPFDFSDFEPTTRQPAPLGPTNPPPFTRVQTYRR